MLQGKAQPNTMTHSDQVKQRLAGVQAASDETWCFLAHCMFMQANWIRCLVACRSFFETSAAISCDLS